MILKNYVNVPSKKGIIIKKLEEKKHFFVGILKVTDEKRRIRIRIRIGILIRIRIRVSRRYGSEDPDPYQNVTDP
jgi:hypothetical protein